MNPRRARQADRRARTSGAITQAAARLFALHGVEHTTVDQIAAAADVSVGSIYVHFGNKDALYLALVEQALDVIDRYVVGRPWSDSPLQRLSSLGEAYVEFALAEQSAFFLIAMMGDRRTATSAELKDVEERIAVRIEQILRLVEADATEAVSAGEIMDLPTRSIATYLWGSWGGVIALHLRQDRLRVTPDVVRSTLRTASMVLARGLSTVGDEDLGIAIRGSSAELARCLELGATVTEDVGDRSWS